MFGTIENQIDFCDTYIIKKSSVQYKDAKNRKLYFPISNLEKEYFNLKQTEKEIKVSETLLSVKHRLSNIFLEYLQCLWSFHQVYETQFSEFPVESSLFLCTARTVMMLKSFLSANVIYTRKREFQ